MLAACSGASPPAPSAPASASAAHGIAWQSQVLDGDVYAAPLVVNGRVIVVTQHAGVYAFDAATGRPQWQAALGTPVQAASLPCGDVAPEVGVLSRPVADAAHGLLYVVAFLAPAHHELFILELGGGRIREHRAVDAPSDSPMVEQQRGALALSHGYVYVPYGGLFGDCGSYHGWVVGAPVGGGDLISYKVPCGRGCGLWAPGGPTIDAAGDLWVAGGNSFSESTFDHGNSVIKLSPDLRELGYFAPTNWAALNAGDTDLGSISPVLLDAGNVWISGKGATGYILAAANPGGIGGQRYAGSLGCASWSGALYQAPDLYLPCTGDLLAIRPDLGAPSFSVRWRSSMGRPGAPLMAGGSLWTIDTATGTLLALDPAGGGVRASVALGPVMHFVSPAAGGGLVFAVGGRKLQAVR